SAVPATHRWPARKPRAGTAAPGGNLKARKGRHGRGRRVRPLPCWPPPGTADDMPPATSTTPSPSNGRPAPSALPHRFIHHGAFGNDRFGVLAERFARFFGTPRFIIGQT